MFLVADLFHSETCSEDLSHDISQERLVVMETELDREFPLLGTNCLFLTFVTNWAAFHIVTCVSDTVAAVLINLTYLLLDFLENNQMCFLVGVA